MNELTKIMNEQRKALDIGSFTGKDNNCPFTGDLPVRGKVFTGILVSKDTHHTAQVEWVAKKFVKKYERFTYKKTKVSVHNPLIINAEVGDMVVIAECRPLSKTKRFVVIKNLGHSKDYMIKRESIEEDSKVTSEKEAAAKTTTKKASSAKEKTSEVTE